jgi:hypothetical protein
MKGLQPGMAAVHVNMQVNMHAHKNTLYAYIHLTFT